MEHLPTISLQITIGLQLWTSTLVAIFYHTHQIVSIVVYKHLGIQQQTIKFQASESQFKANRFAYK
ncbi:hypothetical protein BLOT_002963 [Blomia tropicalis]|nr:hypothetical protein BLOT_002963 [Blomia tropicalis]